MSEPRTPFPRTRGSRSHGQRQRPQQARWEFRRGDGGPAERQTRHGISEARFGNSQDPRERCVSPGSLLWPSAASPVPCTCRGVDILLSSGQPEKSHGAWNQWDPRVGVHPAVRTGGRRTSKAAPDPPPVALRANPCPRLGTWGSLCPGQTDCFILDFVGFQYPADFSLHTPPAALTELGGGEGRPFQRGSSLAQGPVSRSPSPPAHHHRAVPHARAPCGSRMLTEWRRFYLCGLGEAR